MATTRIAPVRQITISGQTDLRATALSLVAGAGVTIAPSVSGQVATFTISASGGGGTSDHAQLVNLPWTSSGHSGTGNRIAAFNAQGAASYLQVGVDVQAYDAQLAALASTTPSAGSLHTWSSATAATVLAAGVEGSVLTIVSGTPAWRALAVAIGLSSLPLDLGEPGNLKDAAVKVSSGSIT